MNWFKELVKSMDINYILRKRQELREQSICPSTCFGAVTTGEICDDCPERRPR